MKNMGLFGATLFSLFLTWPVLAADDNGATTCSLGADVMNSVQTALRSATESGNGGLFTPNMQWAAVVDRNGILCGTVKTGDAWPGSRAIAIAKAETANDFSNFKLAISTANLYAPTQPGGSLYGLNDSNPFNPFYNSLTNSPGFTGVGFNPGGIITFGGGVALYQGGQVIGGLGVSGDTSCADHAVAYEMRALLGLDGIPGGPNSSGTDNIEYGNPPTGFQQPHCLPTDIVPSGQKQ